MKIVLFLIELVEQYGSFGVLPHLMTLPWCTPSLRDAPSLIRLGRGIKGGGLLFNIQFQFDPLAFH
jgi:hypothetical protein